MCGLWNTKTTLNWIHMGSYNDTDDAYHGMIDDIGEDDDTDDFKAIHSPS